MNSLRKKTAKSTGIDNSEPFRVHSSIKTRVNVLALQFTGFSRLPPASPEACYKCKTCIRHTIDIEPVSIGRSTGSGSVAAGVEGAEERAQAVRGERGGGLRL